MSMPGKREDMIVHEQDPYNAEPPPAALAHSALTPVSAFYSRNHGPIPHLDPDGWRLDVDGLVESALQLSLTELQSAYSQVTLAATLQCAGNRRQGLIEVRDIPGEDPWGPGATSTAEWTGVRLRDVLAAAGVQPEAAHVAFAAPDLSQLAEPPQSYGSSIPLAKASSGEVLLAWAMNGEPLTAGHGAPVRVVVPGYIGARSVKWVERITVQREPSTNYFQQTAYRLLPPGGTPGPGVGISLGAIALNSEILIPGDGQQLPAGRTTIEGYALAGDDRSVARVDVSTDGGATWRQADLAQAASPWTWRLWSIQADLTPGQVQLVARAWDSTAALQPALPEHLWNPKGYVNNSWPRVTVTVTPGA